MNMHPYNEIARLIPPDSRVLDLGTGDGEFLERLVREKRLRAEGVEKSPELVAACIERGLIIHQGDILDGLDQYGAGSFDFVLLLGTLQELPNPQSVVAEAFRVGRQVIISYSNFAHIQTRLQIVFQSRRATRVPWYRSTNLQLFSILDFREFCRDLGVEIIHESFFNQVGAVRYFPNLRANLAVSLCSPGTVHSRIPQKADFNYRI